MKTQSNIQSIADDFYTVSNTRPTATRNHQQWSHSFKPYVVKLQRRHRHQSSHTKTKQHHRSNNKQRPIPTIHITVRPTTNNIHPLENNSGYSKETLCLSSKNSWDNEDLTKTLTKRIALVYSNPDGSKTKDGWRDWTSFENEYHQNRNKKKKCTRKHVILSIIVAILHAIIVTVLLIVLLKKSNKTINRTAVSDSANYPVLRLIPNQSASTVVAGSNTSGASNTQLASPEGLYFDSVSNSVIIANGAMNNIVQWTLGASSWTFVAGNATGAPGNASTKLRFPFDVTLDPMGNIYVAHRNNHRIQFFSVGQSIGETIAGVTGTPGNDSILLTLPLSVALDSQLNLYVSDSGNNRIRNLKSI